MTWNRYWAASLAVVLLALGCSEAPAPRPAWAAAELGTDADFRDIFFLDEQRGWIVGGGYPVEGGIVGSTIDGGKTWSFQSGILNRKIHNHNVHLQAVQFLDEYRGFIAADDGVILRTVDGGAHWHAIQRGGRHFRDLQFVDGRHGWAIGGATLFRTSDGGESWYPPIDPDSGQSLSGNAIYFLDPAVGWSVGVGGAVYRSGDGGESWQTQVRPKSGRATLRALYFVDPLQGWVVGDGGTILSTTDGGETWFRQPSGTRSVLTGVHFRDPSTGWAVGFERADSSSTLLHTEDGGATWTEQTRVVGQALLTLDFTPGGTGWAVGERIRPYPQQLLQFAESDPDPNRSSSRPASR